MIIHSKNHLVVDIEKLNFNLLHDHSRSPYYPSQIKFLKLEIVNILAQFNLHSILISHFLQICNL